MTTPVTDVALLDSMNAEAREVAVTSMLDQARQWLERAKESTAPAQDVAEFKAFIATVAEASKQKKLSEAIQLDAVEMVRRSERALGVAIRQGQEVGAIAPRGSTAFRGNQHTRGEDREPASTSPTDFFSNHQERTETYAVTDGVSDEQFESALAEAKEEGNLSRANVVRKVADRAPSRSERKPAKPSAEVTILNDIRLYLRTLARSPQIARLSDAGRQHLIDALQDTITQIEGIEGNGS